MNCQEVNQLLLDDVYGESEAVTAFDDHLAECASCRAACDRLLVAKNAIVELAEADAARDVPSRDPRTARDDARVHDGAVVGTAGGESAPIIAGVLRTMTTRDQSRRRWRVAGVVSLAASIVIVAAVVLGLRVDWHDDGITMAWGIPPVPSETSVSRQPDGAASPAFAAELAQANSSLVAQREQIATLRDEIAAMRETLTSQQQMDEELIAAIRKEFIDVQMRMERNDFRVTLLKTNMRDLGAALARFSASVGQPAAPLQISEE